MTELTEEEREFLFAAEGGIAGIFGGPSAIGDAKVAADQAIAAITERWPNRPQRLLILAALLTAADEARDVVLTEILGSEIYWSEHEDGEWRGWSAGAQPYFERALAKIAGLTIPTIRRRHRTILLASLEAAQAEAEATKTGATP